MNPDWQFILNESSVHVLMGFKASQREKLVKALHELADNPSQRGDYQASDSTGRPVQIKLIDHYLITFWLDNYDKELRVIRIEPV